MLLKVRTDCLRKLELSFGVHILQKPMQGLMGHDLPSRPTFSGFHDRGRGLQNSSSKSEAVAIYEPRI